MEVSFRYGVVSLNASTKVVDDASSTGSTVKARFDFNRINSPEVRFAWRFTRNNQWRMDYLQMSTRTDTGNLTLDLPDGQSFSFNGVDLSQVASVGLEMKQVRMGYSWQGVRIGDWIKLGPMIEGRGILFDASYTTQPNPAGISDTESGVFGTATLTLGAEGEVVLHRRVKLASMISGIPIAGLGQIFDTDTAVNFSLSRNLNLSLAYRYLRLHLRSGSETADFNFRGPVFGMGFRF